MQIVVFSFVAECTRELNSKLGEMCQDVNNRECASANVAG